MKTIVKLMAVLFVLTLSVSQIGAAPPAGGGGGPVKAVKDGPPAWGNIPPEVSGELGSDQIVYQPGGSPTITWLISRPIGKTNNGHGNNVDGVDSSNPGNGGGGPNAGVDESGAVDDEIKGGDPDTNNQLGKNLIKQIDLDTGVVTFIYSDFDVGESVSGAPISGDNGAVFELWADVGGVLTLMDVRGIGPYMPVSSFLVTSQDPWVRTVVDPVSGALIPRDIFRTRADVAFAVEATVSNLRAADASLPKAATDVSIETTGQSGDPLSFVLGAEYLLSTSTLTAANPVYTWSGLSQLTGFSSPWRELGQQHISMRTFADVLTPSWQVGRATVLVWPMASAYFNEYKKGSGAIVAFAAGQTYYNEVEDILVNYVNVYPDSAIHVQMYKGAHVPGFTGGTVLKQSGLNLENDGYEVPQNSVPVGIKIRNVDMEEVINLGGNGLYTLEVMTGNIPWINGGAYENVHDENTGAEYAYINFTIDRSVVIKAQIGTK